MSTFAPVLPSGSFSTRGTPIAVAAITTPGTTFHTVSATASVVDQIWLYLTNTDTIDHTATVELGSDNAVIKIPVPAGQTVMAVPGVNLTGGVAVNVFADTTNKINMFGNVVRFTP